MRRFFAFAYIVLILQLFSRRSSDVARTRAPPRHANADNKISPPGPQTFFWARTCNSRHSFRLVKAEMISSRVDVRVNPVNKTLAHSVHNSDRKGHRAHFLAHRPEQTKEGSYIVWKYILLSPFCLAACTPPMTTAMSMPTPAKGPLVQIEGRASYYGGRHNGRRTGSGAIFHSSQMTAAHRTLPFGTKVIVTNLENSRSCNVEITDRGPARWTGREIDVSEQAARCLDMIPSGVVPVRMQIE